MFPKISIVTPNYNQASYIEDTIQSVLQQQYPNLEYIIIDGGSTDGSIEIIKKYETQLAYWVSEKDNGLYNALNKGFSKSSGDILMYINSDDILIKGALHLIGKVFSDYPDIKWITGYSTWLNESNEVTGVRKNFQWTISDYLLGNYQWIQQESTVWSRDLWLKVGASFNTNYTLAGDLELWSRFFLVTNPVIADFQIGAFRIRNNQLSQTKINEYHLEAKKAIEALHDKVHADIIKKVKSFKLILSLKYFLIKSIVFNHPVIINFLDKLLFNRLVKAERIVYSDKANTWVKQPENNIHLYRI